MIFPILVNGKKLNFILDSGVGSTILFNLNPNDSIQLKNVEKIKLQGLGQEEAVDAFLSTGNQFKLKNIFSSNQKVYLIFNDSFDLSSKMGITIHGIIGYEMLKNFVIRINYKTKTATFYNPKTFEYGNCKKCETFNLEFYKLKPYVNVGVRLTEVNDITPVKLLIDSGGSDAMWLFENTHPDIVTPEKFFVDFLGEGLSGTIYGKRSKVYSLNLNSFELKNATVSYPDSLSVSHALKFKERNGSMGANILKRFLVIFDYPNAKLTLKKNKNFREPFRYNMSGIELAYNGKVLVKEHDKSNNVSYDANLGGNHPKIILNNTYRYTFKPTYKILKLRENSPAALAGLEVNDIVIKVGGKYTYDMKLEEIVQKFYQRENTRINMVIERFGQHYEYHFKLKDMLK